MLTDINAQQLAEMYNMKESTYHSYLLPYRDELNKVATYRLKTKKKKKKIVTYKAKVRNYNSEQLVIVIRIMGDVPNGYSFNGITLIKTDETTN